VRIVTQNEDDDDDAEYSDDYEFCSSASKPSKGRHSIDIMLADVLQLKTNKTFGVQSSKFFSFYLELYKK
jgi:hypothetical protein